MSCRPLDVESFRNRARLPKGITRRKRGGYDESKKVSRTLLKPTRGHGHHNWWAYEGVQRHASLTPDLDPFFRVHLVGSGRELGRERRPLPMFGWRRKQPNRDCAGWPELRSMRRSARDRFRGTSATIPICLIRIHERPALRLRSGAPGHTPYAR